MSVATAYRPPAPDHASLIAAGFSVEEAAEALAVAAAVLYARQPIFQARCTVLRRGQPMNAHAAWIWPGVVRVTLEYNGALIAQSEPGRPTELDVSSLIGARVY